MPSPTKYTTLAPISWPIWARVLVSALVTFHLFAVFVGPWGMQQPRSPLAEDCVSFTKPYVDALSLDHGYRFFAPDPGPSHLIRFVLTFENGKTQTDQFPDLQKNWPRLLYHRHFMLSEFVNTLDIPDALPEVQKRFDLYVRSYARHLLHESGAKSVKLVLVRHVIPGIDRVVSENILLSDPRLYEEKVLGEFSRDELTSSGDQHRADASPRSGSSEKGAPL